MSGFPFFYTSIFGLMKKLIAVIFLIVFAVQALYTAGFTAWFHINQTFIAKKHCINKNRPQLNCDGKCFLAKKIKEAERQQQNEQSPGLKEWVEIAPCSVSFIDYNFSFSTKQIEYFFEYKNNYRFITEEEIFHPPLIVKS